jgi:cell division protein ZapE
MGTTSESRQIEIQGRQIAVKKVSNHVIWLDFMSICSSPRSQEDYLEIARQYSTVIVTDIPRMTSNEAAEAQRFIWLVDVLYDNRVKLVASADVLLDKLYHNTEHPHEFARTLSRLVEMQTQNYLELPHNTEKVTLHYSTENLHP